MRTRYGLSSWINKWMIPVRLHRVCAQNGMPLSAEPQPLSGRLRPTGQHSRRLFQIPWNLRLTAHMSGRSIHSLYFIAFLIYPKVKINPIVSLQELHLRYSWQRTSVFLGYLCNSTFVVAATAVSCLLQHGHFIYFLLSASVFFNLRHATPRTISGI